MVEVKGYSHDQDLITCKITIPKDQYYFTYVNKIPTCLWRYVMRVPTLHCVPKRTCSPRTTSQVASASVKSHRQRLLCVKQEAY